MIYRRNDRYALVQHPDDDLYVHKIVDDDGLYPILESSGRWEYPARAANDPDLVRHVLSVRWPTILDHTPRYSHPNN